MSKDLPYFKFNVNRWITGEIHKQSYATKGVFTDICAWYWSKDCDFSYQTCIEKFPKTQVERLVSEEILGINQTESGDKIYIKFLDSQKKERGKVSEKNSFSGSLGGRSKSYGQPKKANALADKSQLEKKRKEENREEEIYIEKSDPTNFIRIRGLLKKNSASEFFQLEFEEFFTNWKNQQEEDLTVEVFKKMDTDYFGFDFNDENHVRNTFKSMWEKVRRSLPKKYSQEPTNKIEETMNAYNQAMQKIEDEQSNSNN